MLFAINRPSDDDINSCSEARGWSYLIWSTGEGANGIPHVQGYGELEKLTLPSTVRKMLGGRARVEAAKEPAEQNLARITETDPLCFEFGAPRSQEGCTDVQSAREIALAGGMRAVHRLVDSYQLVLFCERFLLYCEPQRDWKPVVVWLWGGDRRTRSHIARSIAGPDAYWKGHTKWWEDYDAHDTVVIDNFDHRWWDFGHLMQLLDRYPARVENKRGSRQFLAKTIVITCDLPPEKAYPATDEDISRLLRRLHFVHLSQ